MLKKSIKSLYTKALVLILVSSTIMIILFFVLYFFILKQEIDFGVQFQNSKMMIFIIIFTCIMNTIFYLIYTKKWLYQPVNLIKQILETENKNAIVELKSTNEEFNYIGTLFEESILQKNEMQNAKEKAEASDILKSNFLSNLSHEIRTPMNAIIGFSDLLRNNELEENEKLEYIDIIDKSGENLVLIIDDLVEMSKIDANQVRPNYSSINLDICINEVYDLIKETIPKSKSINFYIVENLKPTNQNVFIDEVKLKQVLMNLLSNAVKYTNDGEIGFGYQIDKGTKQLHFIVKDTGLGIETNSQDYIFERYRTLESNYTIKVGGLGLGLAISKAYVELMEGKIYLDSTLGKGSTFTFSIPLKFDPLPRTNLQIVKRADENLNLVTRTILIAEDDNINYLFFEKIMQFKNFNIIRASNGQQAVDICNSNQEIDLVLMDIKMPIMNGFDALELIKPLRPNIPIIAQTAYSSVEDKNKILEAGFSGYITKPLNRDKLFDLINQFLNSN